MDPLANMIAALRNAGQAGLESVSVPHSKLKEAVVLVLAKEGFVRGVETTDKNGKKTLTIQIAFGESKLPTGLPAPRIRGSRRVSKLSKRVYKKSKDLRPVMNNYGLLVVSTPEGVMSGYDARKAGLGGEALFTIW